jgi:hypothetical protein
MLMIVPSFEQILPLAILFCYTDGWPFVTQEIKAIIELCHGNIRTPRLQEDSDGLENISISDCNDTQS